VPKNGEPGSSNKFILSLATSFPLKEKRNFLNGKYSGQKIHINTNCHIRYKKNLNVKASQKKRRVRKMTHVRYHICVPIN
jgi:hypothetical protein